MGNHTVATFSATAYQRAHTMLTVMLTDSHDVTMNWGTKGWMIHPGGCCWRAHNVMFAKSSYVTDMILREALAHGIPWCPHCLFYALGRYAHCTFHTLAGAPRGTHG